MSSPDDGASPEASPVLPIVAELVHGAPLTWSRGQRVVHASTSDFLKVVTGLKADGFDQCSDLCGADYLGAGATRSLPEAVVPQRYEVVVNLLSMSRRERIRVRVQVPEQDPRIASLYGLYPGTEAMEREAYDLFGVWFENHPDMSRILLPDDWEGHPLRKDYAVGRIPVQFKDAPSVR